MPRYVKWRILLGGRFRQKHNETDRRHDVNKAMERAALGRTSRQKDHPKVACISDARRELTPSVRRVGDHRIASARQLGGASRCRFSALMISSMCLIAAATLGAASPA